MGGQRFKGKTRTTQRKGGMGSNKLPPEPIQSWSSSKEELNKMLIISTMQGKLDRVMDLLDKKADPNAKDANGVTALMWACANGHKELAELLIKKRARVDARDNKGWCALRWASFYGHKEAVEFLISKRAEVDVRDKNGQTLLRFVLHYGRTDIAEILKRRGARE